MKLTYESLGKYIHEIDVRNSDLSITKLMGVNLSKQMMPSVANIVGTDLSVYKVVRNHQFACKLMSVGRDACLPIALKLDEEPVIISSAYYAFEVNNENELLPEYLMMCFLRPDFDRELWFKTGGDVRGGVTWALFCDMKIPIIPITEQRKVVHNYKVVSNRIHTLRLINENLKKIAICIYKHRFLEENRITVWPKAKLGDIALLSAGGDVPEVINDTVNIDCCVPIIGNAVAKDGLYGFTNKAKITDEAVTVSARGSNIGFVCLRQRPYYPIVRLISLIPKKNVCTAKFLYLMLKTMNIFGSGSSIPQLTVPDFKQLDVYMPDYKSISIFTKIVDPLFNSIKQNKEEISVLQQCLYEMNKGFLNCN